MESTLQLHVKCLQSSMSSVSWSLCLGVNFGRWPIEERCIAVFVILTVRHQRKGQLHQLSDQIGAPEYHQPTHLLFHNMLFYVIICYYIIFLFCSIFILLFWFPQTTGFKSTKLFSSDLDRHHTVYYMAVESLSHPVKERPLLGCVLVWSSGEGPAAACSLS